MTKKREPVGAFETSSWSHLFRLMFFVLVLAIVILEFPGARELVDSPYPGIDTRNLVIQHIRDDGPNRDKNLQPRDEIHSVAGERIHNHIHYLSILAANEGATPQEFTVLRNGEPVSVTVEYSRLPQDRVYKHFGFILVAFAFLLVGLWVYLRRPDGLGALFATNCAILAFFLTHRPSVNAPSLQLAGELIHDAIMLFFPAIFLHFFLVFPVRGTPVKAGGSKKRRTRAIHPALLYSLPLVLYLISGVVIVRRFYLHAVNQSLAIGIITVSTLYFGSYIIASLVIFIRQYRLSPRAQKQKLRIVIAGIVAGIVPLIATTILRVLLPGENYVLEYVSQICLGLVPLTFAYAILKHGAFELNDVVRKGIVYAFLTGAILAGYYVLAYSLSDFMMREFNVTRFVFMPFSVLVFAIIFAPARHRIQQLVDRLFYRGEYVYKQQVYDFNRQLARVLSQKEIFDFFIQRVDQLLKSSFIAVYTRDGDKQLRLTRQEGDSVSVPEWFSLQSFLSRYFSRYMTPLMVEFLDQAWERPNLDIESKQILSVPGLAVCVPVVAQDHFIALILLGEKRSGVVYSRGDSELLQTFAEQLALVLQNAELLQSSLEKERLENEVMLARDIQLSLLPTTPPDHPVIEIFGNMVSSFEVGGDYFDYFFIDDDLLAVAIGDVSGKGIPAAMLMSSIQAVFKHLAVKARLSPPELNNELNSFLIEQANTEQFASFFYGVFDLRESRFTFSNAGQCPALLVKRDYVDRLGQGGMLLGVRGSQQYREGTVQMEAGDLLLLYTDGVTEQKNPDGREYGEERLINFLKANKNVPIRELQPALFNDVVSFGAGHQDDDFTNIFVYYKGS